MIEKITVEELVRKHGRPLTRKGGRELIFPCPKCKRTKFEINIDKNVFHCFRCGTSGRVWSTGKNYYTEFQAKVEKSIEVFHVNYVPFQHIGLPLPVEVSEFLHEKNLLFTDAVRMGMGTSLAPTLRNRVIIPILENGKMVAAVGRALHKETKPKELFLGEAKGNVLYNIDTLNEYWKKVVIVEGIFDAEAVLRAGYAAVAVLGSNITDVQIGKLLAKRPGEILIMMDNDEAGREGAAKIFKKLHKRFKGFIGIVRWKSSPMLIQYKDPGESPIYIIDEAIRQFTYTSWEKLNGSAFIS